MVVLYRKYRPKTFAEVVGQEYIVKTLNNALLMGMVSHAYLFYGPRGTGKCVKFDTKVIDALTGEILTIEEIYKRKRPNLLITLYPDYKLRMTRPSKYIDDGVKPCYKVKTALGREIEVTLSHPFLTIGGWKRLLELKEGDYIAVPRVLPVFGKEEMPEYQIRLIAHLISEGSTYDFNGSVGFTNSDPVLINDFISAARKFANMNPSPQQAAGYPAAEIKIAKYGDPERRTLTYYAVQKIRRNWINQPGESKNSVMKFTKNLGLIGQKSKTKTIPRVIFRLTKPLLRIFLRTLYSGDGGVDFSNTPTISYYSSSKQLVSQIQHLLLRFGIIGRIRYKPVKYEGELCPNWVLEITNRESLLIFIKEISFIGKKAKRLQELSSYLADRPTNPNCDVIPIEVWNLVKREKEIKKGSWVEVGKILNYKKPKRFCNSVRFRPSRNKLRISGEVFHSREILNIANSDIYWDRIIKIKYSGNHKVYDLVVPETHNFVANDFIVHNTTMARLLAKSVNCQSPSKSQRYEPCSQCISCQEINEGRAIDLIEIDAASNRGIDEIRNLKEGINVVPVRLKYKVYIIDEFHQMTKEASNALLKTLEEPPPHAIFVLCTTEFQKVLPTIVSRCQKFEFKTLTLPQIKRKLNLIAKKEGVFVEEGALDLIAKNARGSIRDAESLLEEVIDLEDKKITKEEVKEILGIVGLGSIVKLAELIAKKDRKGILEEIENIQQAGIDVEAFFQGLMSYLHELLVSKISPSILKEDSLLTQEEKENLKRQNSLFSQDDLKIILKILLSVQNQMRWSEMPHLPLELAILEAIDKLKAQTK